MKHAQHLSIKKMGGDTGECVGLGILVVNRLANDVQTNNAAKAEGTTFQEMELRKRAAHCRAMVVSV